MKRILTALAIAAVSSTTAMSEPPEPITHVTDFSECGDLNRPIKLYGPNSTIGDTGSFLRVKTDRGWCDHSASGIDNPVFDPNGGSDFVETSDDTGGETETESAK